MCIYIDVYIYRSTFSSDSSIPGPTRSQNQVMSSSARSSSSSAGSARGQVSARSQKRGGTPTKEKSVGGLAPIREGVALSSTKLAAPASGSDASSGRKVKGDGTPSSDRSQKSSRRESPQRRKQPVKDGSFKKGKVDAASSSADAALTLPPPPSALQSSLPPPPQHHQGGAPSETPPPSSRRGGGKSKKLSARFASADGPERERAGEPPPPSYIEYEGDKNEEGQAEGRGFARFANRDEYEGEWKANKREGQGSCTFGTGEVCTLSITDLQPLACSLGVHAEW